MTPAQFRDLVSLPPVSPSDPETAHLSLLGVLRCKIFLMRGPDAPPNMREVGDALWACLDAVEHEVTEAIEDAKERVEEVKREELLEHIEVTITDLKAGTHFDRDELVGLIGALRDCLDAAELRAKALAAQEAKA